MVRLASPLFVLAPLALVVACGTEAPSDGAPDVDAEPSIQLDAGLTDVDAGAHADAAEVFADASEEIDAGFDAPDAEVVDLGTRDTGPRRDAGGPDAGGDASVDAGPADTGVVDAGPTGPAVLNPGWIGGPCTSNADCAFTGGTCLMNGAGWPGGTCTQTCTQFCPDQSGPLNSVTFCIDDGNGDSTGQCLSRCDFTLSPTGCRDGYVCLPEKRFNQPSVVRASCVPVAGVPGRATPAFDIGDACTTASDCNRNTCLTDMPGGYCTQESCDVVGCPAGSQCFALGLEGFSACLKTCSTSSECRTSESYGCDSDNTCWYVPPPAGTCDLAGAAADCAAYASMSTPSFVVVTKSLRRMAHCSGSTMLGAYCVGLGSSPVLDKEREGDRRTPEGIFYIPRKIPNSQYYKAFLISYPDSADAARGLSAGLITQAEHDAIVAAQNGRREPPQNTALGGLIEIHGNGSGADWTWGCIATEDSTIDLLWPDLDVGDTVVVLH